MREQKFRKLGVWIKAMDLVEHVYSFTKQFPANELYGLTSQLRRAALSVPLNIAEGSGATSDAEFNRFLTIAVRSSYEILCGVEIAARLRYCRIEDGECVLKKGDELCAMLVGLKKQLVSFHG